MNYLMRFLVKMETLVDSTARGVQQEQFPHFTLYITDIVRVQCVHADAFGIPTDEWIDPELEEMVYMLMTRPITINKAEVW